MMNLLDKPPGNHSRKTILAAQYTLIEPCIRMSQLGWCGEDV
jgi:hypothetical protein